jgi:hypothetical protein
MSHWAEIDEDGIVLRVVVGDNNDPAGDEGLSWLEQNLGGTWIKTSYNTFGGKHFNGGTPLNMNYAGIGFKWDGKGFIPPSPYLSWNLNTDTYLWGPPVLPPENATIPCWWDEENKKWVSE